MYLLNTFTRTHKLEKKVTAMVKVITIMDDVYADLYRLKRSKNMSFTEILRHIMKENEKESRNIISFAGSLEELDIDRKMTESVKRGVNEWKKYV